MIWHHLLKLVVYHVIVISFWLITDLREDRQYLIDHPGTTAIATAQASHF